MSDIKTIYPSELKLPLLHALLLSAVAPRPIAFASTIDKEGKVNLSPFSFFNVFSSNPPIMIFSPSRSGRNGKTKHTHQNVLEVPEVVINVVNYPMVEQMSLASTAYDKGVNEFIKAGFTEVPSTLVKPPRVAEAPVAFECEVQQVIELGKSGGAGNLVIAEVKLIHLHTKYLNEGGMLDTKKLDLVARMGDSWYCHANGSALFEIPKPITTKGIGFDQLPDYIKNSEILTANNLGRLANVTALPTAAEVEAYKMTPHVQRILDQKLNEEELSAAILFLAKAMLDSKRTEEALKLLMISM